VEATFKVLKTDLDLRPIYRKTDDVSMAHLHLGLLAYWVVNTVRHQLKKKRHSQRLARDCPINEHPKSRNNFGPKRTRPCHYDTPVLRAKPTGATII
jgi:hypothetical protein